MIADGNRGDRLDLLIPLVGHLGGRAAPVTCSQMASRCSAYRADALSA